MRLIRKTNKRRAVALVATFALISSVPIAAFAHASASRAEVERTRDILSSRDALSDDTPTSPAVSGRLATVIVDNAPINAPREQDGRLLSVCPKGTYIIVSGEVGDYYSVVMVDRSIGFIAKDNVDVLDYQISTPQENELSTSGPLAHSLVQTALQYLGVPYVWGGNTASGIDCSGLVKAVYASNGMNLPRTAAEQSTLGFAVPLSDVSQWQPGDRMYFQCHHSYVDHAGMYIGNGYFVHSSIGNQGVAVTRVDSAYYWNHLVTVRRSPQLVQDQQVAKASPAAPDYESGQE
jgi:cell wall-associated NlpC family hydrolase